MNFDKLNSKGRKQLLSLKDIFDYVQFCEWYKDGGFGITEFTSEEREEYAEYVENLFKDGYTKSVDISLVDYWDGEVVEPDDPEKVDMMMRRLRKL